MNINYRIYGDQVSLFGQPMGTTITLQSPAYTTFAIDSADSTDNIIVKLRVLSDAFVHMHVMNTVLAQIADKAPQVPPTGEPDFTQALQNAAKLIKK